MEGIEELTIDQVIEAVSKQHGETATQPSDTDVKTVDISELGKE